MSALSRFLRIVVPSVGAGGLVALSIPPWAFWPLAFAGIALLAWRLDGLSVGRRAWVGLLFGFGLFGPTLFWISEFHAVGYVLLLMLEGSFFAAAAALVPADRSRIAALAALPAAYALAEVARGVVPFGGLPMGGVPLGQVTGPLAPSLRIGGAYLLTALAVALGAAVVAAAWQHWRVAAALVAVPVLVAGFGAIAPDGQEGEGTRDGDTLRVAIVQGGGPRGFRAVFSDPGDVLAAHLAVSDNLRGPLDLVLWPENTIDVPTINDSVEEEALSSVARKVDATVVAGVTEDVGADNFQNVAVAWGPDGRIVDRYVKVHRVPFGEYVPLRGFLERVVDLSVLPRDAVAGGRAGILRTPAGSFGVAISYEVFFGERGRAAVHAGGQALLVPTNAASFTTSQVPTQEVAAGQLRAWETGRWVLMSAPTGYGAAIDPSGQVVARTTLGVAELLRAEAALRDGRTIYVIAGDWPVVLAALALVAAAWWWSVRRSGSVNAQAGVSV